MSDPIDITMSEACADLFAALAAFQGEVTPPKKASTNPHFKSRFADLADVLEAVRAPLAKHGLSLTQIPVGSCDGYVRVVTLVAHKSGQWLKGVLDMPLAQKTPQGVGSAISYARRYCAMAALGIAAEDDDGESAEGRGGKSQQAQKPQQEAQAQQAPQQQRPDKPANTRPRPLAGDVVKSLMSDLERLRPDRETLARFYEYACNELAGCGASEQQKTIVQKAFGERCRSVGLKPVDVASGRAA